MKKPRKTAVKKIESKRIATYLPPDIIEWVEYQSSKLYTTESAFIRDVLRDKMKTQIKGN